MGAPATEPEAAAGRYITGFSGSSTFSLGLGSTATFGATPLAFVLAFGFGLLFVLALPPVSTHQFWVEVFA